jgi:hypothetical protein
MIMGPIQAKTYTRSLFQELKLRLKARTDEEVKRILRRLYNVKNPKNRAEENEQDVCYNNVVVAIFKNEPVTWESFTQHNLGYLDFPLWLSEMVDRGDLTAAQLNS